MGNSIREMQGSHRKLARARVPTPGSSRAGGIVFHHLLEYSSSSSSTSRVRRGRRS